MLFVTRKDSETGKKITALADKEAIVRQAAIDLSHKYGFQRWSSQRWPHFGNIMSVQFDSEPDKKAWKKNKHGNWVPKLTSALGKEVQRAFDKAPSISQKEFNQAIGFDNAEFGQQYGLAWNSTTDHYGFNLNDNWDYTPPNDVMEVTSEVYAELVGLPAKEIAKQP